MVTKVSGDESRIRLSPKPQHRRRKLCGAGQFRSRRQAIKHTYPPQMLLRKRVGQSRSYGVRFVRKATRPGQLFSPSADTASAAARAA
ncbi:hypothetical protein [Desulfitobacterium hafniense]|uniref:Uncharacterized protein n=2 Tax=Desulfitobacterium hafniense TaxID=49338 RepID=Q24X60_DESHY|nr:hypothetical protein [Desulfitobacterium hafniense]BAE83382.1 hypothetical protein DSY1593 [Desulfitobacterium hafniense Y51]